MTLFIQLHLLTFAPPANLNRDDTGAPKTAIIGGKPRLRLSSQSLKRAWRTSEIFQTRLQGHLGERTQRFGKALFDHLIGLGHPEELAQKTAREVAAVFGKIKPEADKNPLFTEQLAFISAAERADAFRLAERLAAGEALDDQKKIVGEILKRADTAADIAMFGRMFADHPDFNREAAVQVAHAFTTHAVTVEDDYYTAVDDLNSGEENVGAGFVGEAGFGSGLFYLYICIDVDLLKDNLSGDEELAKAALAALVEAAAKIAPNGKQASFASRMRTSYILAEKGSEQPRSLAGAFAVAANPAKAEQDSREKLDKLRKGFARVYGEGDLRSLEVDVNAAEGKNFSELVAFVSDWTA